MFPKQWFDTVTMFFSSLNYMIRLDDLERLLKAIYYVLREGSVFVADTPNPYEAFHSSLKAAHCNIYIPFNEASDITFFSSWSTNA